MAKALDITVIAEGIERKEQLNVLTAFSCDEIQGYLYGRPVPAQECEADYLKNLKVIPRQPPAVNLPQTEEHTA